MSSRLDRRRTAAIVSAAVACAAGGALGGTFGLAGAGSSAVAQHSYASRLASASGDSPLADGVLPGRGAYWMVPGTRFLALQAALSRGSAATTGAGSAHGSAAPQPAGGGAASVPTGGIGGIGTVGGIGGIGTVGGIGGSPSPRAGTESWIALPKKDEKELGTALEKLGLAKSVKAGKITVKADSSGMRICGASLPKNLKQKILRVLSLLGLSLPPVTIPPVTIPPVTIPPL